MAKKLYHGNCSCNQVKFEINIDLTETISNKCNCSFCKKRRLWDVRVVPEDFKLLSGDENLTDYQANLSHRYFCKTCGITVFTKIEDSDWNPVEQVGVNVGCLEDITTEELQSLPVRHLNGKDNTWTPITDSEEIRTM